MPAAPRDRGTVRALVRRSEGGRRELLESATLSEVDGMPGDSWGRRPDRNPEAQLTAVEWGVAQIIANGQPLALSGDQIHLDLDLSKDNLPTGGRARGADAQSPQRLPEVSAALRLRRPPFRFATRHAPSQFQGRILPCRDRGPGPRR